MSNFSRDPILLTPGPLTTSLATKMAMLRDWGSWDSEFNAVTAIVRERLLSIAGAEGSHVCVPLQGSGTFAVEAAVNTLVPRDGHLLALIKGAYGTRLARLARMMGRRVSTLEAAEDVPAPVAESGKCIEGPPGIGFVLARRSVLAHCAGNSTSLSLDLHDQWQYMERTTQWRFTPPTHVVAALSAALESFEAEGGQAARLARYTRNCEVLVRGMEELGFQRFLDPRVQAPIIVTFHAPVDPRYGFREFYDRVRDKGFVLYPGKLTQVETFRVGCIGAIGPDEMRHAVNAVRDTLAEIGIEHAAPA